MKKPILLTVLRGCFVAALVSGALHAFTGAAQPSQYMTYQGYLTDGNGNPLGTTNTGPKAYDVVFRIWDVPTGGATSDELHAEVQTVTVDNGYFSVLLGQGLKYLSEPFASPLSSVFTNTVSARYVEITIQGIGVSGANVTLLPRLQLVSSPYSFLAANAQNVTGNGVITAGNIAPGAITSANIAPGTIQDGNMAPGTITTASIAPNTITAANIAANTITSNSIAPGTITGVNIAPDTITSGNIASAAIKGANIASATITGANIAAGAVTANNLNSSIGLWTSGVFGVYRTNGNVGIGTAVPGFPLEVEGSDNATFSSSAWYYLYNTTAEAEYVGNSDTAPISIKAGSFIEATGLISPSDRRIKDIVDRSNPQKDLDAIEQLKVTDYRMKDRVDLGDKLHKGFIAQEVQAVIPEAVNKGRDYIPSIYAPAEKLAFDPQANTLSVTLKKAHDLKKGDKVRLITEDGSLECDVLAAPNEETFVAGPITKAPARVFVFGKQVDDFLAVDYNRIFCSGIGAIQELASRVEKLEAREARMAELERKAARMDVLEREVADLKQTVAHMAEATKTARQASVEEPHAIVAANLSR